MKRLLFLFLLGFSICHTAHSQTPDSVALPAIIANYNLKMEAARHARIQAIEAAQRFRSDSLALEKDSSGKAVKAAAQSLLRNSRDSLEQVAQALTQVAAEARNLLLKQVGVNPTVPTPNGHSIGITLICIICGFTLLILILLSLAIRRQGFSLKDALSENIQDKLCIPNPEYKADSLKTWFIEWSNSSLSSAKKNLDAATAALNMLLTKYPDENTQTGDQKQEIAKARQAQDVAQAACDDARNNGAAGPGMATLANLARLFPPTIEVSASGINLLALQSFDTARKARIAAESSPAADPQKILAARQAEETAFQSLCALKAPEFRASISRLIAFISALLLIITGLGSACFFFYFYLVNGLPPDLSALPAVLISLGIGMAPYAVNKIATAASKDKSL